MPAKGVWDRAGGLKALEVQRECLWGVQSILVNTGYTGQPFAQSSYKLLCASTQVVKRSELHTLRVWKTQQTS
jgi:hypothetical protein